MRLVGIDIARSLAILFAMYSHIYSEVNLGAYLSSEISVPLRFMFQIAPPIFIILFGTMLEVVYYPKWISGARRTVSSRLFLRAMQCWVLYAISIIFLFINDENYSFFFSMACLLFMGNSPYTEILKFYAFVLAAAPLLLWARERWGLGPLIVAAVAYHASWTIFDAIPDARHELGIPLPLARLIKFLTGFGSPRLAGPSVLHGLTLIIAGQCLGKLILWCKKEQEVANTSSNKGEDFHKRMSALLFMSSILTLSLFFFIPSETIKQFSEMNLRLISHPYYFIIGTVLAYFIAILFVWIIDTNTLGSPERWRPFAYFGRTSMFTFAWGNILLYSVDFNISTASNAYLLTCLLLGTICVMSYTFDLVMKRSKLAQTALVVVNKPLSDISKLLHFPSSSKNA